MATSGSVKTNSYSSRYLIFSWSQKSQDIASNTTTISWTLKGAGGSDVYYMTGPVSLKIDGVEQGPQGGKYWTTRQKLWNGTQIASGTKTFTHNSTTGEKNFTVEIAANVYVGSGSSPNCTGNGNFNLTTIPRTPTFTTSPRITNKTETSITIDRGATDISSSFYYKVGSGGWVNMANQTATISNLSANTNYSITVQARNANNTSLTKDASLSETTYNYPYFTSKPDFAIGSAFTIQIYNPLGRSVEIQGQGADGSTTIFSQSGITGTSHTGFNTSANITAQYNSIPNSKNGTYKVRLVRGDYGGTSSWENGGKYTIVEADCYPTLDASKITYTNDSATQTLMGNTTDIIQGQSTITVKLTQAAVAKNGATISSYSATINNNTQAITVNTNKSFGVVSTSSAVISVTATDSRGLTVTQTKTITIVPYISPTVNVEAKRDGGYGTNVTVIMTPVFSSLGGKNTYTLTGTYTKKGGSAISFDTGRTNSTSTNAATKALSNIDNDYTYTISVTITDKFGNSSTAVGVGTGTPTLTIMPNYQSVGINAVPANSSYALNVNGNAKFNNDITISGNATIDGTIQKNYYAIVGLTGAYTTGTNNWYKFASTDISGKNTDRNIWFKVYTGYDGSSTKLGELIAHVRVNNTEGVFGNGQLNWITCGSGIDPNHFKLAYYSDTENNKLKVELWANVLVGYSRYRFIPQAEGTGSLETAGQWTLYKTTSSAGESSPTEGYTLITSSLMSIKNSTSGNAATANYSSRVRQPNASRITTPNFDHEYISNRATKRLDTATGSITEADPGDGWIETYFWDTSSPWDAQLYIPNGSGRLKKRVRANAESWPSTWQEIAYYSDIPADSGWQNISRASGYNAGTLGTPQYKKVGNQIFIRGSWSTSNNIGSSSVVLGTLPSGCRPPHDVRWIVSENGTGYIGKVGITTSGDIKLDWFGNTFGSRDTGTFTNIVTILNFWTD